MMDTELHGRIGVRSDHALKEAFLQSGKVPFWKFLSMGVRSLVLDPILLIVRYMPGPFGFKIRQLYYRNKLRFMGKGVLIDPGVEIAHPHNVYLDDFCYIGRLTHIHCPEGYVRVGKRCHVHGWILGHGGVEIGDYVGSGGMIFSITDSHANGHRMGGPMIPYEQRNLRKAPIRIGKDAFIGQGSMIMPGVTIGEGAIVGPFSMVVRNVQAWTVVMGTPAIKIDERERVIFGDI